MFIQNLSTQTLNNVAAKYIVVHDHRLLTKCQYRETDVSQLTLPNDVIMPAINTTITGSGGKFAITSDIITPDVNSACIFTVENFTDDQIAFSEVNGLLYLNLPTTLTSVVATFYYYAGNYITYDPLSIRPISGDLTIDISDTDEGGLDYRINPELLLTSLKMGSYILPLDIPSSLSLNEIYGIKFTETENDDYTTTWTGASGILTVWNDAKFTNLSIGSQSNYYTFPSTLPASNSPAGQYLSLGQNNGLTWTKPIKFISSTSQILVSPGTDTEDGSPLLTFTFDPDGIVVPALSIGSNDTTYTFPSDMPGEGTVLTCVNGALAWQLTVVTPGGDTLSITQGNGITVNPNGLGGVEIALNAVASFNTLSIKNATDANKLYTFPSPPVTADPGIIMGYDDTGSLGWINIQDGVGINTAYDNNSYTISLDTTNRWPALEVDSLKISTGVDSTYNFYTLPAPALNPANEVMAYDTSGNLSWRSITGSDDITIVTTADDSIQVTLNDEIGVRKLSILNSDASSSYFLPNPFVPTTGNPAIGQTLVLDSTATLGWQPSPVFVLNSTADQTTVAGSNGQYTVGLATTISLTESTKTYTLSASDGISFTDTFPTSNTTTVNSAGISTPALTIGTYAFPNTIGTVGQVLSSSTDNALIWTNAHGTLPDDYIRGTTGQITTALSSDGSYWTLSLPNAVTIPTSLTVGNCVLPTSAGVSGQILTSNATSAASWVNPENIMPSDFITGSVNQISIEKTNNKYNFTLPTLIIKSDQITNNYGNTYYLTPGSIRFLHYISGSPDIQVYQISISGSSGSIQINSSAANTIIKIDTTGIISPAIKIGTTTSNYSLPTSAGTNGYLLTTNGTNSASWVNPFFAMPDGFIEGAGGNINIARNPVTGVFSISLSANIAISSSLQIGTYTFPTTAGSTGQILTTNGTDTVSWVNSALSLPSNFINSTTNQITASRNSTDGTYTLSLPSTIIIPGASSAKITITSSAIAIANTNGNTVASISDTIIVAPSIKIGAYNMPTEAGTASGQILVTNGSNAASWSTFTLPTTPTGNNNKILTSNNTNIVWSSYTLPASLGSNGQVLSSNGSTSTSWSSISSLLPSTIISGTTNQISVSYASEVWTLSLPNTITIPSAGTQTLQITSSGIVIKNLLGVDTTTVSNSQIITPSLTIGNYTMPSSIDTDGKILQCSSNNAVWSSYTIPTPSSSNTNKLIISNGSTFTNTGYQVPATIGANKKILQSDGTNIIWSAYTLPSDNGSAKNFLLSNGDGTTSWGLCPSGIIISSANETTSSYSSVNGYYIVGLPTTIIKYSDDTDTTKKNEFQLSTSTGLTLSKIKKSDSTVITQTTVTSSNITTPQLTIGNSSSSYTLPTNKPTAGTILQTNTDLSLSWNTFTASTTVNNITFYGSGYTFSADFTAIGLGPISIKTITIRTSNLTAPIYSGGEGIELRCLTNVNLSSISPLFASTYNTDGEYQIIGVIPMVGITPSSAQILSNATVSINITTSFFGIMFNVGSYSPGSFKNGYRYYLSDYSSGQLYNQKITFTYV